MLQYTAISKTTLELLKGSNPFLYWIFLFPSFRYMTSFKIPVNGNKVLFSVGYVFYDG